MRKDPKDKEIRELKDMMKELTATIKELPASIRHPKKTSDNEDAADQHSWLNGHARMRTQRPRGNPPQCKSHRKAASPVLIQ